MPKRKSPEGPEGKEASKVTKQEPPRRSERLSAKPSAKPETKAKKAIVKKVADDKAPKAKKSVPKGKKDDGPAHNGETKTNETSGSTGGQFRGEKGTIHAATRRALCSRN
ncbi:high mobility group nucleosome-binding domain-containing protein 3 isoform X5 [Cyclopterus lumpus]|uniref:high mobility group nucleosome-binding domain-containing protein 3 isoform X5 n=1 Tax=Cyclopterus lumpus TaxID=8103 RepID=UPI001486B473|nr:high mobility group nucleosome-binding domain-containing protein 3 isoform X5 [Cyclopterus lumpus]